MRTPDRRYQMYPSLKEEIEENRGPPKEWHSPMPGLATVHVRNRPAKGPSHDQQELHFLNSDLTESNAEQLPCQN